MEEKNSSISELNAERDVNEQKNRWNISLSSQTFPVLEIEQ
ncbi:MULTISPECIES: hypothetical protein [Tetragenococcus]|nr:MULTISPECIES: hypothetical protein [Tetragenococcus]GEN91793.1 hypothetical protein TKO01_18390 [Tetragenococcus koreensis]